MNITTEAVHNLNFAALDQQALENLWRGMESPSRRLTESQVEELRSRLIYARLNVLDESLRKQMPDPGLPSLLAAVSLLPLGIGIFCLTSSSPKVSTMTGVLWLVGGIVLLSACIMWIVWSIRGRNNPCLRRLLLKERVAAITLLIMFPCVLAPFIASLAYKMTATPRLMFGALTGAVVFEIARKIRNGRRIRRQVENEVDAIRASECDDAAEIEELRRV